MVETDVRLLGFAYATRLSLSRIAGRRAGHSVTQLYGRRLQIDSQRPSRLKIVTEEKADSVERMHRAER
jgi:hypothetical protein